MKKTWKRTLALLLAFCLVLALPLGASAIMAPPSDVPDPDGAGTAPWYSEAVYYLWYNGPIIRGDNSTRFRPDRSVTREEFVTLLGRVAEDQGRDLTIGPDGGVHEYLWVEGAVSPFAAPYLGWALTNGILKGRGTSLAAKETMTRQEMAVILLRFANYMGISTPGVEDGRNFDQLCDRDEISSWAQEDVQAAYLTGLVNGIDQFFCTKDPETGIYASGYLHYMKPKMVVTRAQAAQAVYNYVKAADLDLEFFGGLPPL